MANRYNTPTQAQFMNSYVPIPFQELLQAGISKQQQYNTGQAALDTAQSQADALKYIPSSEDERYITEDVMGTVKEIVDEYGSQDLSQPAVMRAVNKKLRGLDRNRINRVQQSAEGFNQFNKDVRQLNMSGKGADYLNKFDPTGFSSEFDVFNQTAEAALDHRKAAETLFNNLPERYLYEKDMGNGIKGIMQGVGDSEIRSAAQKGAIDFLGSPEGSQYSKYLNSRGVAEEDIQSETESFLYNVGLEQKGAKLSSTYKDPNFKENTNKGVIASSYVPGERLAIRGVGNSRRQAKKNTKGVEDYSDFTIQHVDSKGKSVSMLNRLGKWATKGTLGRFPDDKIAEVYGEEAVKYMNGVVSKKRIFKDDGVSENNFKDLLFRASLHHNLPIEDLLKKPIKEQDDLIDTYLEDFQSQDIIPDTQEIKNTDKLKWLNNTVLGEDVKGNKLAKLRKWYNPTSPIGSTPIDFKEVVEEYPRDKYNYTISHELSPYNPIMPSAYMVDIEDEGGNTVKTMYMSGPERNEGSNYLETSSEQNLTKFNLYNQIYSDPRGYVEFADSFNGNDFLIEGTVNNPGDLTLNVRDSEGKIISIIDVNEPGITRPMSMSLVQDQLKTVFNTLNK